MLLNGFYQCLLLSKAFVENKLLFLIGDFNADLLKFNSNKEISDYFDIISSFNLLPQTTLHTRVTDTSSAIIDHIFCNSVKYNTVSGKLVSMISDHFFQFLCLKEFFTKTTPVPKTKSYKYDWSSFNEQDIQKIH